MVKIYNLIFSIINLPLYYISLLIPKNEKIWVFGAWFGKRYSDNSKYLFEYMCKNHQEINSIWITRNTNVLNIIRAKGYNAYLANSPMGFYYSMTAKINIVSTGKSDLNYYLITPNQHIINLWHGTPLKKIMYDDKITKIHSSKLIKQIFPFKKDTIYSLFCVPSEEVATKYCSAFREQANKMLITGYPRNDGLFLKTPRSSIKLQGIYMPTHRGEGDKNFIKIIKSIFDQLNIFLIQKDILLYVKLHYYHIEELQKNEIGFSNILFLDDKEIEDDIYGHLQKFDFLITDYSSIFFDYLLLNRPIIFFPFDYDDYITQDRELYYDYEDVTPGFHATNIKELISAIENIASGFDPFKKNRNVINKVFNTYSITGNSERVYYAITNSKIN